MFATIRRIIAEARDLPRAPGPPGGCGRRRRRSTMQREIVLDTETTGLDPAQGHRDRRDRGRRAGQPPADRSHLPRLPQPRARHAGGGVPGPRPPAEFLATTRSSPRWSTPSSSSWATASSSSTTPPSTSASQRRARALRPPPGPVERAVDTLLLAQRRFPGASEQPGRPLPALRRSTIRPQAARRAARLRAAGRRLPPSHRRPADRPGPGPPTRASAVAAVTRTARPRPHAPSPEELAAHAAFVAKLEDALWNL